MRRLKRHKIKEDMPECSTSHLRGKEEHDLAYYIHDRVELMHQVFSVLKYKDLKAMAPECVRHISVDDLQELCTEELLGISSKRLCAILDGAEPPSDTESSSRSPSPENLETISLDSISSDEEILSQSSSKKKKHKHRRRSLKEKRSKSKRKSREEAEEVTDKSKASRAGLTVLELLELQARARAIRAQLQQEHQAKAAVAPQDAEHNSSDGEVEIKEEPAEVVEISSDEEKPKIEDLQAEIKKTSDQSKDANTVTRRNNDLVITVPQSKPARKIKLNRTKSQIAPTPTPAAPAAPKVKEKPKAKDKVKKKKNKRKVEKEGSDHDEITLQLSDSEKMDLLEDLERKSVSSVDSSPDSDSESDSTEDEKEDATFDETERDVKVNEADNELGVVVKENEQVVEDVIKNNVIDTKVPADVGTQSVEQDKEKSDEVVSEKDSVKPNKEVDVEECTTVESESVEESVTAEKSSNDRESATNTICENADSEIVNFNSNSVEISNEEIQDKVIEDNQSTDVKDSSGDVTPKDTVSNEPERLEQGNKEEINPNLTEASKADGDKDLSEGEVSDRESSEIKAVEVRPEVVCISDDETSKSHKKKKKKDKKSKKGKKSKKKDFRESADENFFKESEIVEDAKITDIPKNEVTDGEPKPNVNIHEKTPDTIQLDPDSDDVYEILELSDDSSCYEVEGTVLSKEPTAEEIEALSAKIDEIDDSERAAVITDQEIRDYEEREREKNEKEIENVSWKDRYLESKKVRKVLSTANILNALRKKNRDLKKKIEESKTEDIVEPVIREEITAVEGSIEQYNTLHGSTKYVDPVAEEKEEDATVATKETEGDGRVTKEMKKDAKQLLKMYKMLLKYNDMSKTKDPNRKKQKKKKDKRKKESEGEKR